jgi:hypothetical protein
MLLKVCVIPEDGDQTARAKVEASSVARIHFKTSVRRILMFLEAASEFGLSGAIPPADPLPESTCRQQRDGVALVLLP